jgi:RNA polymerase sigma-54 factor
MAMEARLSLKQSQRVVMTPLLQQAIQLLQLSTLELQEVVQKELLENPLLEEIPAENTEPAETTETTGTTDAAEGPATADAPPTPTVEPIATELPPVAERKTDELPYDPFEVMFDAREERSLVAQEDREDPPFENMVRSTSSLSDHLEDQLRLALEDPRERRIGEEIIGNIDEDGYLRAELGEVAERCQTSKEEVERILTQVVQKFDPTGVGARGIQECLLIQLRADPPVDPLSEEIIEQHFDDLSRRRYPEIARALKRPLDRVMESVEEIMGLEPKPGRSFGGTDTRYIVPDVFVYKLGNDYTVVLNEDGIPRLRVSSLYRSLRHSQDESARQYVDQKLRSALWLIKSVDQRQRTLRKVTSSIVKFQREFLDKGLAYLRPLSLRDVGEDVSMHESTISRVTTNKYVETPQGLFELKFFFHSGIASGDGEMVSSVSVKKMIQDLLAGEDAAKPLSDQEVAAILKGRSLTIARRTVAKYREELGILPSHQRRLAPRKR